MTHGKSGRFGEQEPGPVEVDETYIGGKHRNMTNAQRKGLTGRGLVGKVAVVGAKDRATKQVVTKVMQSTVRETLQGFVKDDAAKGTTVYMDDAKAYRSLPFNHTAIKHSLCDYLNGDVCTNGIEALQSMIRCAHNGTFHRLSPKQLDRHVRDFARCHNIRARDTIDQIATFRNGTERKRPWCRRLIADNGLESGVRVIV